MNPNCILAVGQTLGRQPTEAEIKNIEAQLARAMRAEAARDPRAWLQKPRDEQVRAGAARATKDLMDEAALKQRRRVLQVIATGRLIGEISAFPGTQLEALHRMLAFHADTKGSIMSVESRAKAIERDAMRQMIDTLEATSPKFFGVIEDSAGLRDLVRELHGERTGNADAASGAKAFKEIAETLRERFNRAGGDVGHLDDWGMPHHHSQLLTAKAGRDRWVSDVLPLVDRARYVDEYGRRLDDAAMRDFLGHAWETIATGGANKAAAGVTIGGARANRGSESRQIHFKNADAFLDYQAKFGERTPYEVILGHISGVSKDIALVETFGPNPDHTYSMLRDRAVNIMTVGDPVNAGKYEHASQKADTLYNLAAGRSMPVANPRVAQFFDGLRNLMVASKLGSAVISAVSDDGTMRVAAHVNNLPEMQLSRNELAALNPANKMEERMANRAGLALNTLAHTLNRFGNEVLGAGWTSKMANLTLRASGLNALTDARRRAYGVTMMGSIGSVVRRTRTLADLDPGDHRILASKGVTPEDWEVFRLAKLEDWGGGNSDMLTPDAIYRIPDADLAAIGNPVALRQNAATRLLATVLEETDVAVIEPGNRERAFMGAGLQRGSWRGEITRSLFLFKSFPISMITRHWDRALSMPSSGGSAGYMAALVASTTVLGMLALQASQVVQGKDPRDMTEWETWVQALLKGGALSLYGDFLLADQTEGGQSALASAAGPVAGLVEDSLALTVGNIHQAARGEDTHFGAEAVRLAKSNLPGANLWYTRAATDHLIFHQMQEYLSPGYLNKMERRARKEYGQDFWWAPGEAMPERAPDLEAAVGGN